MNVRAGSKVTVHICECASSTKGFFFVLAYQACRKLVGLHVSPGRRVDRDRSKVWYEWLVDVDGTVSTLHNPNGRSYYIGL
eukprot:SAG31_NODE_505_length_14757_cov_20.172943_6_plen_81_part_00